MYEWMHVFHYSVLFRDFLPEKKRKRFLYQILVSFNGSSASEHFTYLLKISPNIDVRNKIVISHISEFPKLNSKNEQTNRRSLVRSVMLVVWLLTYQYLLSTSHLLGHRRAATVFRQTSSNLQANGFWNRSMLLLFLSRSENLS